MQEQCNYDKSKLDAIFMWAGRFLLMLSSVMIAYGISEFKEFRAQQNINTLCIAVIQSTRFTGKEGQEHLIAIVENKKDISSIQKDISEIKVMTEKLLEKVDQRMAYDYDRAGE